MAAKSRYNSLLSRAYVNIRDIQQIAKCHAQAIRWLIDGWLLSSLPIDKKGHWKDNAETFSAVVKRI